MQFKGNAIATAVIKQFKPAYFPFYTEAFAFWDSTVRMTVTKHFSSANPQCGQAEASTKELSRPPMKRLGLT